MLKFYNACISFFRPHPHIKLSYVSHNIFLVIQQHDTILNTLLPTCLVNIIAEYGLYDWIEVTFNKNKITYQINYDHDKLCIIPFKHTLHVLLLLGCSNDLADSLHLNRFNVLIIFNSILEYYNDVRRFDAKYRYYGIYDGYFNIHKCKMINKSRVVVNWSYEYNYYTVNQETVLNFQNMYIIWLLIELFWISVSLPFIDRILLKK